MKGYLQAIGLLLLFILIQIAIFFVTMTVMQQPSKDKPAITAGR